MHLGMSPITENHLIIYKDIANKFYNNINISNIVDLNNGKEFISFFDLMSNDVSDPEIESRNMKNISVVVSSVITASARIYMSQFKTNKSFTLYYTDTDSIDIDGELEEKLIGNELGLMKLEHVFNQALFLAPKVYGGLTAPHNSECVRIKGLKNPLKFEELKPLLIKYKKNRNITRKMI